MLNFLTFIKDHFCTKTTPRIILNLNPFSCLGETQVKIKKKHELSNRIKNPSAFFKALSDRIVKMRITIFQPIESLEFLENYLTGETC